MPRKRLEDLQPGFGAGLVRGITNFVSSELYEVPDLLALPPNAVLHALGARLTVQGALQKLHGSRRLHASALDGVTPIRGGFAWRKGDGTVEQLVTTNNLFTGTYAVPMTWTSRAGVLDSNRFHDFAAFRDGSGEVVYIADGGALNKWNGTAVSTDLAGTPSVRRIAVYNQRLFGITGTDQTLYWSALNNGDSLGTTGGGAAVIRTFGGQHLTALAPVGGSLLLFHANAISRFTGYAQDDIDIDAGAIGHAAGVGTLAPRSVVVVDLDGRDAALFLTKRGLYAATEGGVFAIPAPFEREVGAIGNNSWDSVHAVHNPRNHEVWFNILGFIYTYRYDLKAWTGPITQVMGSVSIADLLWASEDDTGAPAILGATPDGFVRRLDDPDTVLVDVLSDGSGGTRSTMAVVCRPFFFGDETVEKVFRHLYVTGQSINAPATVTVNWTTSTGDTGEVDVTLGTTYGTAAAPLWGRGTYLWLQLTDNGTTPTIIAGVRAEAFALGRRR